MTSNPEPIVQHLKHEFQNLLTYVTGSDARAQTAYTGEGPYVHSHTTAGGPADGGLLPMEPAVHARRRVPGVWRSMGTGVVEGACRHLVNDHMEPSGMRWTTGGAQRLLDLRRSVIEN